MGEKSSQITHEIEETRTRLGWNLQELEDKVKRLADWRQQFERRPFAMMGVALCGGMLLVSIVGDWRPCRALGSALKRVL